MYLSSISNQLHFHEIDSNWNLKFSHGCYNDPIRDISWSDDGKYLLQVNPKGLVEILSATDVEVKSLQHVPFKETWAASFNRDGHRHVAIGCKTGQVHIWDTKFKNISKTFPLPASPSVVNILSYNAKNTNVAASMQNGETAIYGITSNSLFSTLKVPRSKSISAMKFHHEIRALLGLATDEGHLLLRDIITNKDRLYFKSIHKSPVSDFVYSPINRDVLLSCGLDRYTHVYDIRTPEVVSTILTSQSLTSIDMDYNNYVAIGCRRGAILIYDLRDFSEPVATLSDNSGEVKKVKFQPPYKKKSTTDYSLKEAKSPVKSSGDVQTYNTSPMFEMSNSPPSKEPANKSNRENSMEKPDSFLIKLDLDKSMNNASDVSNGDIFSPGVFMNRDISSSFKTHQINVDNNLVNSSTPIVSKSYQEKQGLGGNKFDTQSADINLNDIENGLCKSKSGGALANTRPETLASPETVRNETVSSEELKDLIRMTLADHAEDSRNSFMHMMFALTKQKLFLEKEVSMLSRQMQDMQVMMKMVLEENRRLIVDVELLKSTERQHQANRMHNI